MMVRVRSYRAVRDQMERESLRLLCSDLIQPGTRARLTGLLNAGDFTNALHRAVFEEIGAIGEAPARRLRELLPGRVTLRGFPEFELKDFLGRDGARDEDIDCWFESLLQLTEERPAEDKKAMGQSA